MTCKHCGVPIEHCDRRGVCDWPARCTGWRHSHTGAHQCPRTFAEPEPDHAEPEPDQPARVIHLIRGDITLACGHDGQDLASSVPAEVTCAACKAAA